MKMLDNEQQKQFYVAPVVKMKSVTEGEKGRTNDSQCTEQNG
jgi:hypothetical protein